MKDWQEQIEKINKLKELAELYGITIMDEPGEGCFIIKEDGTERQAIKEDIESLFGIINGTIK